MKHCQIIQSKSLSPVCGCMAQGMSPDNVAENPCVSEHLCSAELATSPVTNECHDGNPNSQGPQAALPNDCMHHPAII